jgi:hypothetical protein
MSDLADIENALVNLCANVVYPSGDPTIDGVLSPVTGAVVRVFRGFPLAAQFEADAAAGAAQVAVYPEHGMTRDVTKFAPVWQQLSMKAPTFTASIAGTAITFGGIPSAGQVAGVQYGVGKLLTGVAVRLVTASTASTVALALASKIPSSFATGPVLTLSASTQGIAALVVSDQAASMEVRRQEQGFRITVYAPTPAARDTLAGALDAAIAGLLDANGNPTRFITLNDGSKALLRYRRTDVMDGASTVHSYRRDIILTAEYGTSISAAQPTMLFGVTDLLMNGAVFARAGVVDA